MDNKSWTILPSAQLKLVAGIRNARRALLAFRNTRMLSSPRMRAKA
ncbi:MAG: hypothetical protein GQ562_09835 [Anaerolineales bacterium]|nr:hypothetical protein [Anaerolineales bacterium]